MPKSTKSAASGTLPSDGRLKGLKRADYFWVGERIKSSSRMQSGFVVYNAGVSDASIAADASLALQIDVTERHVTTCRRQIYGNLADEGATAKERIAALSRMVASQDAKIINLSDRIKELEDYVFEDNAHAARQPAPTPVRQNGATR